MLAAQFDRWNSALQTGDPEIVASLYADDGVLLPTVSNQVRTCHAGKVSTAAAGYRQRHHTQQPASCPALLPANPTPTHTLPTLDPAGSGPLLLRVPPDQRQLEDH